MYHPVYSTEYSALYFSSDPASPEDPFCGVCNVFVCGALQSPVTMSSLLGLEPRFAPAAVTGYKRTVERIDGEDVAFMVPDRHDPRSVLTGVVWLDLTRASLDRVESLELAGGLRERISIKARVGELDVAAFSYVRKSRRWE